MRRADRLFKIIQLLRRGGVLTASKLAGQLEVSVRTVYRDLRDLIASGTPIDGEPGVGYRLRADYDLPPLMFDREELEALVLGARIVVSHGDSRLGRASRAAMAKIESVLPKSLRASLSRTALFAPKMLGELDAAGPLATVRQAISKQHKIDIAYTRKDGATSRRILRPLGAFFWGSVWTLAAWCELRGDFRSFRLDRIEQLEVLAKPFVDEPGKTLRDYLLTIDESALDWLDPG